jgi:hypothetical protein
MSGAPATSVRRDPRRTDPPPRRARGVPTMSKHYYNHGGIQVTSDELSVHGRRYQLAQFSQLRIARGSTSRATSVCLGIAGLFLVLSSCSWQLGNQPVGVSIAGSALAVLAVLGALVTRRVRPRPYELWAEYRGHTVQVLWSRDERVFNQIRFAICRARQADAR